MDWEEDSWPEVGNWGVDLYWTTRSDGCRYEYWSSAPGDNEYGVLVRIDREAMTAIGRGSDDGLELFEEYENSEDINGDVIKELIREGWHRPSAPDDDDESSDDED